MAPLSASNVQANAALGYLPCQMLALQHKQGMNSFQYADCKVATFAKDTDNCSEETTDGDHEAIIRQVNYSTQVRTPPYQDAVFLDESDLSRSIEELMGGRAVIEPPMNVSWSVGAKLHYAGQCRPCAWSWRPDGCSNGASCKYCHMCGEEAVKNRSKTRVKEQRARRRAIHGRPRSEAIHGLTASTSPAVQPQKVADPTKSGLDFRQLLQQHMNSLPMPGFSV